MLNFTDVGRGEPALLLMPFLAGSQREWTEVVSILCTSHRCITIDLPGFGQSADDPGYSVEQMSRALIDLLPSLGLGSFLFVGHSMAGKVSAVTTRSLQDQNLPAPAGLILIAPSPPGPEPMPDEKRKEMLGMFQGDDPDDDRTDAQSYIRSNSSQPLPSAIFNRTVDDVLAMDRKAWRAWLNSGSKEDCSTFVGVLDLPVLIVAGTQDGALGPDAQRQKTLPHFSRGELTSLDSNHLIPLEQPAELASLIKAFLSTIAAAPVEAATWTSYLELIESHRVSAQTRDVLLKRLEPDDPAYVPQALTQSELELLRSVFSRVIPQTLQTGSRIDLAARLDRQLAAGTGDGWRYAALPVDIDAYKSGLLILDKLALTLKSAPFISLTHEAQDSLLEAIAAGRLHAPAFDLQLWFQDLRAAATQIYVAHPSTLARIGYSGIADDPSGFIQIGIGQTEPWEPESR